MLRVITIATACILLVASGVVHGVWSDRWSDQADLAEIAKRMESLPMTIGAWQGSVVEMEQDPKTGLAGMLARRYVHTKTGKSVTLFLGCGRAGPVCVHTPEVCYGSSGFEVEKPTKFQLKGSKDEFWTARFVARTGQRQDESTHLLGMEWIVRLEDCGEPARSFAGEKTLYKMYLIRELVQADEPMENDACVEFMNDVLPAFRQFVLH